MLVLDHPTGTQGKSAAANTGMRPLPLMAAMTAARRSAVGGCVIRSSTAELNRGLGHAATPNPDPEIVMTPPLTGSCDGDTAVMIGWA